MIKETKENLGDRFSEQRGYATIVMALLLLGVVTAIGYSKLEKGSTSVKLAAQESAKVEIAAEANKMLSIAGFMVANGLLICREQAWQSGGAAKSCRYVGAQRQDADFSLKTFGLSEPTPSPNGRVLSFALTPKAIVDKTSTVKVVSARLTFELIDAKSDEELQRLIGERSQQVRNIDRDDHVIVAKAELTYRKENRDYSTSATAAFKRPIAMTRVALSTGSACAGQCNSSLSQNPFPSCRGPQTINDAAVVEIRGTTTNLGPGVLYDLAYERSICLKQNLNAEIGANGENCFRESLSGADSTMVVPISDYLLADKEIRWTDTAPCKSFVAVTNGSRAGQAVQHVTEAGRVTYQLDATSNKSRIEPFRLNEPVDRATGKLPGRLNVIYVVPTH